MNDFDINLKKLDYLYKNLINGLVAIFLLTMIIYFTFQDFVDNFNLTVWSILNILILTFRGILLLNYSNTVITTENYSKYYWSFFALAMLSASLWGSSAFFILPDKIEYQMIILLLLGGLISGSAVSLSSRVEMFYFYLYLSMLPFIYIFYTYDTYAYNVLSVSTILYTLVLLTLSKKISNSINSNILLAQKNQNLILQLQDKVEEATMANKSKSEFLSVMSHEIRTPLNAIMGFVNILKRDEKDLKKQKYLDTIESSSKILTNVINDILDITKIESGKFTLEMTKFNPKDEFDSIYLLFEQNAITNGITIVKSISPDLPSLVESDILRIKQIISNLLSNAIKFTPRGKKVEFIIKFDKNNSSLYFEVKDDGIGIAEENIQNITKSFTQADSSTSRKYGGTGLGLSIVTKLLKLLDSELIIESKLGQGSRFMFNLKVNVIETADKNNTQNIDSIDNASYPDKKILVAEDDITNQMMIKIILEEMNIDVTMVNDGVEAVKMFKENNKFDMVLMDINMPNKNGLDAMLDIKEFEINKEKIHTPIISVTANSVDGDREMYLNKGFDDYISKPIDTQNLLKILKKYF